MEINAADFVAVVQPGVNTEEFQDAVEKRGLFYPPDPASRADNFIGGNIATNAGGPRCLKYGVTRDYVLGLEVVLADGDIVRLGGRTHKNKTGFDLHRLFVGSEGLLGVITEATLKLIPLPPFRANLAVGFGSMNAAVRALQAIFAAGFLPCAVELADEFTLAAAAKRTGSERLRGCKAHLIVELDGQENSVRHEIAAVEKIVRRQKPLFVERGFGDEQCEAVWQIRREFSYALRDTGLTKLNEDIVVPRGRLEDLFKFAATLQKKHGLPVACFGHAGDGNIHTNVMVDYDAARRKAARRKMSRRIVPLGDCRGRRDHRRTRHRPGQETLVAAGGFPGSASTASHRETRARSARHFESGQVCVTEGSARCADRTPPRGIPASPRRSQCDFPIRRARDCPPCHRGQGSLSSTSRRLAQTRSDLTQRRAELTRPTERRYLNRICSGGLRPPCGLTRRRCKAPQTRLSSFRFCATSSSAAGLPRRNSSNFLVNSRASTTSRSGNTSFNSPRSFSMRYGDS